MSTRELPAHRLPPERDLQPEFVPPGHYYSALPSLEEVRNHATRIFDRTAVDIPGVDLNLEGQLVLLQELKAYYPELPFLAGKSDGLRYYFDNDLYSYSDAIFLYCMIRHARPKRIIEVGSGFSSCVCLDTNELFFENAIQCTFIEPDPQCLESLLKKKDLQTVDVIPKPLQEVELSFFAQLGEQDILFIDSSHVSKVGSDVNRVFFEILPLLEPGVLVHFHDVFYPFQYPAAWVYEGRAWNEAYLLRGFLQYNRTFRIRLWNALLARFRADLLERVMPLCMKNTGGSIWLEKMPESDLDR